MDSLCLAIVLAVVLTASDVLMPENYVTKGVPETSYSILSDVIRFVEAKILFMPPTLKKWGAYCFRLVRLCVCAFVRPFKKNLKLGF